MSNDAALIQKALWCDSGIRVLKNIRKETTRSEAAQELNPVP